MNKKIKTKKNKIVSAYDKRLNYWKEFYRNHPDHKLLYLSDSELKDFQPMDPLDVEMIDAIMEYFKEKYEKETKKTSD